jgi:hypothetical protein
MLKTEIAGKTITYKNAPEIPIKALEVLKEVQGERTRLELDLINVRRQEKQLRKFLGNLAPSKESVSSENE